MDNKSIDAIYDELRKVVVEWVEADKRWRDKMSFAKAAFTGDVAVPHVKWSAIRHGKTVMGAKDIIRISAALGIEPVLLWAEAYSRVRNPSKS